MVSLRKCTYKNFDVIIVDNASTDDSLVKLKSKYKEAIFLESKVNRGFAGGCNIGILYALYNEYDFILLLNNDTVVKSDFLDELVLASKKYPNHSIFGGKAYYYEDKKKIHMAGAKLNWIKGNYTRYGADCYDSPSLNQFREVEFTSAYFLFAKAEVFKNIGLLCEDYFFGQEEVDFGVRYSKYGYKVIYVPTSIIWHKIAGSHIPATPRDIYNVYRNKIIYMKKFLNPIYFKIWLMMFKVYAYILAPSKLHKLHVKYGGKQSKEKIKAAIKLAFEDSKVSNKVTLVDLMKVGNA
jgi:hypothetical protein